MGALASGPAESTQRKVDVAKPKVVELTPELSATIQKWQEADNALDAWKKIEFALRQEIVAALCDPKKLEGAESLAIGNGWKITATKKQNYSLTNKEKETEALLASIAQAANRPDLAANLVKWSPELSKTAYKELLPIAEAVPTVKQALAAALTIKPGAPDLKLVPPETPATT